MDAVVPVAHANSAYVGSGNISSSWEGVTCMMSSSSALYVKLSCAGVVCVRLKLGGDGSEGCV